MRTLVAIAFFSVLWVGCQGSGPADEPPGLVVYSGRSESLIGPILEQYEQASGVKIEARYGATAEMAATLMEEGAATPADVFLSQDAAALGALAGAGLLKGLPPATLEKVPVRFRDRSGRWVGVSGRARSVVYNTERIESRELPKSLEQATRKKYRGRFGLAPTNGSFQAHMAVYRAIHGKERLVELLAGLAANQPVRYPKNSAIVEAVLAGEVDFGLVNHYYLWRALAERPGAPGANFFMAGADGSGFVNVAGAAVLSDRLAAFELVDYLVSSEGQRYFAEKTGEYPLVEGVEAAAELPALDTLSTPAIDFAEVANVLEETLTLIHESGLVQ